MELKPFKEIRNTFKQSSSNDRKAISCIYCLQTPKRNKAVSQRGKGESF